MIKFSTSTVDDAYISRLISDHIVTRGLKISVTGDFGFIFKYIHDNIEPEELFDTEQLGKWAERNGYKKE